MSEATPLFRYCVARHSLMAERHIQITEIPALRVNSHTGTSIICAWLNCMVKVYTNWPKITNIFDIKKYKKVLAIFLDFEYNYNCCDIDSVEA